jgi:hypothetical protein
MASIILSAMRSAGSNMRTEILLSPIVSRNDGFAFDTFSAAEGLKPGFAYRRVEQASYDRKAMLHGLPRTTGSAVIACETLADFRHRCAGVLSAAATRRDFAEPAEAVARHL